MDETVMDESQQQKAPRAGRRAVRTGFEVQQPEDAEAAAAAAAEPPAPEAASREPLQPVDEASASSPPPPRSTPAFGAAEDQGQKRFAGVSRRKAEQLERGDPSGSGKNTTKYDVEEKEAAFSEIPELEEEGQEDITRLVADAPKVRAQKVQDIAELDEAAQFHLPETDDRDIDLSLLTSCLCSLEQVEEADEVWDPEQLFAQLASELHAEEDKAASKSNAVTESSITAAPPTVKAR